MPAPDGASEPTLAGALRRPDLPPWFERWHTVLAPHSSQPTTAEAWAGCLVLVEHGRIEVQCREGVHRSFATGDVLALGWLPVVLLRNRGPEEAILLAIRRRASMGRP
jgi:hypothetical protein